METKTKKRRGRPPKVETSKEPIVTVMLEKPVTINGVYYAPRKPHKVKTSIAKLLKTHDSKAMVFDRKLFRDNGRDFEVERTSKDVIEPLRLG